MVKASIAGSSLGSSMVAGGKRKNGHKRNCGCHFCENMTKKAQRNGYEQDLERANEKKRGGPKKKNGHRLDCGCPICQNMMNSKKSQGSKYGKKTKKYRGGDVSVKCGDIDLTTGKIECHEAFILELTELEKKLTKEAAEGNNEEKKSSARRVTEQVVNVITAATPEAVKTAATEALVVLNSLISSATSSSVTPSLMTTESTAKIVNDIIAKLTALKNITNRADVDGGGSRKRRRTKKRRGSRRR